MKICRHCKQDKSYDEYYRSPATKDGRSGICKVCHREKYNAAYLITWKKKRQRLRKWLRDYKADKECADCGGRFHPVAMQFDHLPGFEKKGTIGHMVTCSQNALEEELKKCELVCANCHAIRTYERNKKKHPHQDWDLEY